MASGLVGVVRVLGLTDLFAGFLALALGTRLGRTAREREARDDDQRDADDQTLVHTATSSGMWRAMKAIAIAMMPRMIAPKPIQKINNAADRPG